MRYSENILSVTAKLHCSFLVSMNAPLLHTAQYLKGWRQNFGLIRIKRASSQLLCNCITKGDDEWRAANWQKLWQHSFSSISLSWITSLRKQQDNWSHYIWDAYKCLNYKKKRKKKELTQLDLTLTLQHIPHLKCLPFLLPWWLTCTFGTGHSFRAILKAK